MQRQRLPWRNAYLVVEPGIRSDGVRIYPFDGSFPIAVGFNIFGGRHNVRMNRHEFFELIYMYHGSTDIQVVNRHFHVKKGDLVTLGPNLYHRILNPPAAQVRLVSLNFQPTVIRGSSAPGGEEDQYLAPFLCQDSEFPHVVSASTGIPKQAINLILKIHAALPASTRIARLAVRTHMKMLLFLLVRHYEKYLDACETLDWRKRDIERLSPVFRFLEQNYSERIEIEEAARLCAMSSSHFMRFFKRVTGQSFLAYLNSFRVAKGQILLRTTEKPLAEISGLLGFCSQSYFGEVFRALVGATPLVYRRRFKAHSHVSVAPPSTM
jgi:AraC-like DNA-binding protein/mannose-6-phosphate isomerase-like protein (cupin superfamily)